MEPRQATQYVPQHIDMLHAILIFNILCPVSEINWTKVHTMQASIQHHNLRLPKQIINGHLHLNGPVLSK